MQTRNAAVQNGAMPARTMNLLFRFPHLALIWRDTGRFDENDILREAMTTNGMVYRRFPESNPDNGATE